jgi:hypothetical protein
MLNLPHPLTFCLTHCVFGQLLNRLGIHLLHCAHSGERTTSYDIVWDVFASITKDERFYVLRKQIHVLQLFFL